jgi:hypothetical protein
VDPPVVGRDWSPVSSITKPVVTAVELQATTEPHPLQPRRAARRYLRIRGTARADSRGGGVGLAPGPQALPMPAAALILYIYCFHLIRRNYIYCTHLISANIRRGDRSTRLGATGGGRGGTGSGRSSPLATGRPGRQVGAGAGLGGAGRGDFVLVQVATGRLGLEIFRPR